MEDKFERAGYPLHNYRRLDRDIVLGLFGMKNLGILWKELNIDEKDDLSQAKLFNIIREEFNLKGPSILQLFPGVY